jgi:hypothetical protein
LLAILRLAGTLPGYRSRFDEAGLRLAARPAGPPEREWSGVAGAFSRLRPLDRAEVRADPSAFLSARTPVFYRRTSSGTSGRGHVYFADREWNRVRLEGRARALAAWGLEDLPILNLASRLWPAGPADASLVGTVDEAFCARLEESLARGPAVLRGYPSRLCEVATAWRLSGHEVAVGAVRAVICTGECLFGHQAAHLSAVFRAPVVNEYGCHEAGLSGFACPEHGALHLDDERAWIERIDGEIVATDLWNRSMPMVRYRCGDRIELPLGPCPCGRPGTVARVLGRREGRVRTRWGEVCEGEVPMPALPGAGPYQAARMPDATALVWAHPAAPGGGGAAETAIVEAWALTVLDVERTEVSWLSPEDGDRSPPARAGSGPEARWLERVTAGPWDLDRMARTLPPGPLERPGRLLLAACSPETLTARRREAPAADLLSRLLAERAVPDPRHALFAARALALAVTRLPLDDPATADRIGAVERRLAEAFERLPPDAPPALRDAARSDLAIVGLLTRPAAGLPPSEPPARSPRRLDALSAQHLLAALELAREATAGERARRLRPLLALLLGDAWFFAPRFGDWLLASWSGLLGLPTPPAGSIAPPDDPFCAAWAAARRALPGGGRGDAALELLHRTARGPEERARAWLESGYAAVWRGEAADDALGWIERMDRHAEPLSGEMEPGLIDPIPWAPILRALPEALARGGLPELAYHCLVASTTPTASLSAFDRISRGINDKTPMVVDLGPRAAVRSR